jgi:mannose-6-phosphate isomerase-like protein (cupin superfamily)
MSARLPTRSISREEMLQRVAYFKDLQGFDGGLPDSDVDECRRKLFNVIGFQPPQGDGSIVSPVGAQAAENAAIKISEGFNLGFCKCTPGHGPLMHNHDTNETFMPITGTWRCSWNEDNTEFVDVGPLDVVSFPPGVARRFENVTFDEPGREHILLFVIGGNAPQAEFSPQAVAYMETLGKASA